MPRDSIESMPADFRKISRWPATPSEQRLLRAIKNLTDPDSAGRLSPKDQDDLEWAQTLFEAKEFGHSAVAEFYSSTRLDHRNSGLNNEFIKMAKSGDTDRAIGMGFWITRAAPGGLFQSGYAFAQLLRNDDWMGVCPALPTVKGMRITIRESDRVPGEPGYVLAVPDLGAEQIQVPAPQGPASLLEYILTHHGAVSSRWSTLRNP